MIFSILCGGFLLASFFLKQPLLQLIGAEALLIAERLFAALLFFAIADAAILQVRRSGDDNGMRIVRIIGFGAFLAVLILGLIKGPESAELNQVVIFIQKTLESALAGLVCLGMIFAMYRLPSQAPRAMKSAFVVGLILFLLVYSGLPQTTELPEAAVRIFEWIRCIPQGALTGLLIGIALGGAVTALRFILNGKLPAKEDK